MPSAGQARATVSQTLPLQMHNGSHVGANSAVSLVNIHSPYDPAISLLWTQRKPKYVHSRTCTRMFRVLHSSPSASRHNPDQLENAQSKWGPSLQRDATQAWTTQQRRWASSELCWVERARLRDDMCDSISAISLIWHPRKGKNRSVVAKGWGWGRNLGRFGTILHLGWGYLTPCVGQNAENCTLKTEYLLFNSMDKVAWLSGRWEGSGDGW